MAYTLEQIYEVLGKTENGGAMVADLQGLITGVRNEAAQNRITRNKVLDALGLREDGGNLDETLKGLTQTIQALKESGAKPEEVGEKLAALQKEVTDLSAKYQESQEETAKEKAARLDANISAQLVAALSEGKAASPKDFAKLLKENVKQTEAGELVFSADGKELSIADGVKGWLGANTWAVANTSASGTGSPRGNAGGAKSYSMNDLKNMTREEINENWETISKGINKGEDS